MRLYWIRAKHFTAGALADELGTIRETAPIIAWMRGKSAAWVVDYCRSKGYKVMREKDAA